MNSGLFNRLKRSIKTWRHVPRNSSGPHEPSFLASLNSRSGSLGFCFPHLLAKEIPGSFARVLGKDAG